MGTNNETGGTKKKEYGRGKPVSPQRREPRKKRFRGNKDPRKESEARVGEPKQYANKGVRRSVMNTVYQRGNRRNLE